MMPVGDFLQHAPSGSARAGKSACVTERAIGDHGDAVLFAPREHRLLDRALAQMIEHLVASRMALPGDPSALRRDRARRSCSRPTTGSCRRPEAARRRRPCPPADDAPRQCREIAVQTIGLEPRERPLARRDRPVPGGVLRKDLGDEENLVAPPGDRRARPTPRLRPNRTSPPCRYGSCRDQGPAATRRSRSPNPPRRCTRFPGRSTATSRIVEPNGDRSIVLLFAPAPRGHSSGRPSIAAAFAVRRGARRRRS